MMKRTRGRKLGAAMGMLALASALWGEEPSPKPAPETNKTPFQAADADADGKVTRPEMTAAMCRKAFAGADANGDRGLDWQEWSAVDKAPGARERFDALDADKDGNISFFEFSAAARKATDNAEVFTALDKNGDGTLSQDEYQGHPHFKILSVRF